MDALKDYGEILAFAFVVLVAVAGWVSSLSKTPLLNRFSMRVKKVEDEQDKTNQRLDKIEATEEKNHKESMEKIENMRVERHKEITELRFEILQQLKEGRDDNTKVHGEIQKALVEVEKTIVAIATELRVKPFIGKPARKRV